MNKILLLVALILIAVAAVDIGTSGKITGYVVLASDKNISVSIKPVEQGRIFFFDYLPIVEVYEPQSISVEFINTGSATFQQNMEITIMDTNLSFVGNYTDDFVDVLPGQTRQYNIQYVTDEPGYYWIRAMSTFSGKYVVAWGLYQVNGTKVLPYYPPIIFPPLPADGSGGASAAEYLDSHHSYLSLEHPPNITLTQNQSTVTYVVVKNIGDADASNVVLLPKSLGIKIDVTPKLIPEILVNDEGVFIISLDASNDTEPGTYPIDFIVMADDARSKGHIDVIVKQLHPMDEFNSSILNYAFLLKRLRNDAIKAGIEGKNTTSTFLQLDEGDKYLDLARSSFSKNDYFETRRNLLVVKEHIENAALELARARITRMYHAMFPIVSILLLLIAFAILAIMLFMHHRQRAKKQKEEEGAQGELPAVGSV